MSAIDGPARLRREDVVRRLQRGPLDRATIATVIAEQLCDDEFDALTAKQRAPVALRRLGLTALQCADALDLSSGNLVDQLLSAARRRGVTIEQECAA